MKKITKTEKVAKTVYEEVEKTYFVAKNGKKFLKQEDAEEYELIMSKYKTFTKDFKVLLFSSPVCGYSFIRFFVNEFDDLSKKLIRKYVDEHYGWREMQVIQYPNSSGYWFLNYSEIEEEPFNDLCKFVNYETITEFLKNAHEKQIDKLNKQYDDSIAYLKTLDTNY